MATKSFTREIRITEPDAVKKISEAMKVDTSDKYRTSIQNVSELQAQSRKTLAGRITKKY